MVLKIRDLNELYHKDGYTHNNFLEELVDLDIMLEQMKAKLEECDTVYELLELVVESFVFIEKKMK